MLSKDERTAIKERYKNAKGDLGRDIKNLLDKIIELEAAYAKLERAIRHDSICGCCIYRGRSCGEELYESKDWGYGCKSWEFARLAEQEGDSDGK